MALCGGSAGECGPIGPFVCLLGSSCDSTDILDGRQRVQWASSDRAVVGLSEEGCFMSDPIINWNRVLLDVIRRAGGPPTPLARGAAMLHGAVYDAVNSVLGTHEPYLVRVPVTGPVSVHAAVAWAAHETLATAFPYSTVDLAAELEKALADVPAGSTPAEIAAGKAVGLAAARAMIEARQDDGADDTTPYVPGTRPGEWQPTGSGPAATPNWHRVRPFTLVRGSQFRPPRPGGYRSVTELLRSAEYAAQFNEVKLLGEADSVARTAEQTEVAFFWANDLDGTYKPPGHLFEITRIVSELRDLDLAENARLFALVALALADAGIVAWDSKYATDLDLWRPETAIREANTDGNGDTARDESWQPLSRDRAGQHFSPPFPAYVSGHATFGAAHAAVLRIFFGTDNITFTATTEDPHAPRVTRTFNSFTQAALENARSRIYLGVHFQWDGDHGFLSGTALGEHVATTQLRSLTG
jgi:PAP2 superfamily